MRNFETLVSRAVTTINAVNREVSFDIWEESSEGIYEGEISYSLMDYLVKRIKARHWQMSWEQFADCGFRQNHCWSTEYKDDAWWEYEQHLLPTVKNWKAYEAAVHEALKRHKELVTPIPFEEMELPKGSFWAK